MQGPFRSTPRSLNEGVGANVAGDVLAVPAPTWGNLVDFLQPGQTDRHAEWFLSPFQGGEQYDKRMLLFFCKGRKGMDEAGEGWGGFLAAFLSRMSLPRQQRSLCSLGRKR